MDKTFSPNSKESVQEHDFSQSVISIGAHRDNDIVLPGEGILAFHATVLLEGEGYRIIPAEAESQIWVDGSFLEDAYALFDGSQQIEIGEYALFFQSNGLPSGVHVILYTGTGEEISEDILIDDTADAIIINMIAGEADIEVEQSAFFEFEVVNAGPVVARFAVTLRGVPKEWVEISPSVMNLNEGKRQLVRVRVTPPREPESEAGIHTLQVVATSPTYGRQRAVENIALTIQPFYEFSLGSLAPRTQRIPWRKKKGTTYLPITNRSNNTADFNLLAMDDENGCSFDFLLEDDLELNRQASFKLQPHESIELPIQITPLKNPMFSLRSKQFHYTTNVQIPQQVTAPQIMSGSVKRVPLFGWWSIMVGLATLVLALFFILQPNIRSFDVAAGKDVIELGDTTKLVWDVSPFATRLSLSNLEQPINRGQVSQRVAPELSTSYELVSGNWLSGMFGIDQKQSVTVLVVPPTPQVNVFEVDRTEISKGQMVRVRWSVSEADEVLLTIDEVVYPLTEEEYSGEREVLLEKDALVTLEAKNASGSELQSYFVNVVPPYININAFTVWVRSDSTALNPSEAEMVTNSSGGKLFSPADAPDPNFPVKFVEMVPEPESETGYRVQFNPDVRDELQKGEQVMLEWDIEGADSLQIAPFEDALPGRGTQPFFPQESMNFVMTAQSGELEGIFMLPVKIYDGEPPEAPTIDFFKGSPLSMLGAGEVEFSWSVSGEWTRVSLSNAEGIVADYLNPVGFTKLTVDESSTLILTAYNGELTSAKDIQITVDPALIDPGLIIESISPTTGRSMVGGQLIVTVDFNSIPAGSTYPTGTITVTDKSSICEIPLPALTCNLIFTTSGTKSISASFPGDTIYLQSKSPDFAQQITVSSAQVDITPSFYFVDGTTPVSVEHTEFDLNNGLRTLVEVRPKNTVLADDDGNMTVSICEQDANEDIIESTCTFVGAAPVKVATTNADGKTIGYGYADITIRNFNASGIYGFLFEYTHMKNAIDPTRIFQPNVEIKRAQLMFGYSGCTDEFALTTCSYGLAGGASEEIVFDLYLPDSPDPILLSSLLPAPLIEAFSISIPTAPTIDWDCSVKTVSGTYKLVCNVTGLVSGTTYSIDYDYENQHPLPVSGNRNDYHMGSDPDITFGPASFDLQVLSSTKTKTDSLNGVKTGARIRLSGPSTDPGVISILDGSNVRLYPSAGFTLEEKNGKDVFGVENEGVNCTSEANGSRIVVKAANADCFIFLKHVGNYIFVATFDGDNQYSASVSGDTRVAVVKQNQITGTLEYLGSGGPSFPANLTTNIPASVRVVLDGPSGGLPTASAFPPSALADRKLLVTLDNSYSKTNCSIDASDSLVTDLGNSVYEVTIAEKSIGTTVITFVTAADFSVTCAQNSTLGLSLSLAFSDKTTPLKDSDDFEFGVPVALSNKAVSDPSAGSATVSITRDDASDTNMLSGSLIDKLHFGQKYSVVINDSSSMSDYYGYTVYYTVTYKWPFLASGWSHHSTSATSPNPVTASNNAYNAKKATYNNQATWSVDPTNFLTGVDFDSTGSTCSSSMPLSVTGDSKSSGWTYTTQISSRTYWSGLDYYWERGYEQKVYEWINFNLTDTTGCKLVFEGASTNTPVSAANAGTIGVSASSGNTKLDVNETYSVDGIDKQSVSMSFSPSTAQSGYVGANLPFTISLSSSDITGGTALEFVNNAGSFSTYFSPKIPLDVSCPNLSQIGSLNPITQTYTSSSAYATCTPQLKYVGNKYYAETAYVDLPDMTFTDHNSSVAFTTTPSFTSGGAFAETIYSGLKVRVSDNDSPVHTSPIPSGDVKIQVLDSGNTVRTCSNYTLTTSPTVNCDGSDNSYTLTLINGETPSFSLLFKSGMISTGNKIKLTYAGDGAFNGSNSSATTFTVKQHVSSVDFRSTPSFVSSGATQNIVYSTLYIDVTDNAGHSLTPTGDVKIEVYNGTTKQTCSGATPHYALSGPSVSCAVDDSYTLPISSGSTNAFSLTFTDDITAASGYFIRLSYSGDTVFDTDTTDTGHFAISAP
ncbi:MAG: hypothetical protein GY755_21935 [Chloroflexi bacterium]|nr:hypothetical protein [Chloroflexota bacterium]